MSKQFFGDFNILNLRINSINFGPLRLPGHNAFQPGHVPPLTAESLSRQQSLRLCVAYKCIHACKAWRRPWQGTERRDHRMLAAAVTC